MNRIERWTLYWCFSEDHDEDWFVVARTQEEAGGFFTGCHGGAGCNAQAVPIAGLPAGRKIEQVGWAQDDLLVAMGAHLLSHNGPRKVSYQGVIYEEGTLKADIDRLVEDINGGHDTGPVRPRPEIN